MKTKLLTICLLLVTSQVFANEECIGADTSKWDNCVGEVIESSSNDGKGDGYNEEYNHSTSTKGYFKKGIKHGLFIIDNYHASRMLEDGRPITSFKISEYYAVGHFYNNLKKGIWSSCFDSFQNGMTYKGFQIQNYNNGKKHGVGISLSSCDKKDLDLFVSRIKKTNGKVIMSEGYLKIIYEDGVKCNSYDSHCDSVSFYHNDEEYIPKNCIKGCNLNNEVISQIIESVKIYKINSLEAPRTED